MKEFEKVSLGPERKSKVMRKKEIRGERGIVNLKWVVKNQEKEAVLETETTFMLQKKSPI